MHALTSERVYCIQNQPQSHGEYLNGWFQRSTSVWGNRRRGNPTVGVYQ